MLVTKLTEHDDGSATVYFDLTKEEHDALLALGILTALKEGIKEGEKLICEGEEIK